jgi:hypothetical protein
MFTEEYNPSVFHTRREAAMTELRHLTVQITEAVGADADELDRLARSCATNFRKSGSSP